MGVGSLRRPSSGLRGSVCSRECPGNPKASCGCSVGGHLAGQ